MLDREDPGDSFGPGVRLGLTGVTGTELEDWDVDLLVGSFLEISPLLDLNFSGEELVFSGEELFEDEKDEE